MNIPVRVITFKPFPSYLGASFLGSTDISLNGQIMLRGLRLFRTALGFHLKLPSLKKSDFGSPYNFLSAGLMKNIQEHVVMEYERQKAIDEYTPTYGECV